LIFLRGVLGVAVGFGLFLGAIRLDPATGLLLTASITIGAALLSGYMAALIAGSHEFPWAATIGFLMIGASFYSMRATGIGRPGPYQLTIAGCGPVSTLLGAAIRLLTKPRTRTLRG
jgi:hypothetical protein